MNLAKGIIILISMAGIILLIVYFMTKKELDEKSGNKTIYKYLPRTLEEEELDPIYVSEIFKPMFTQPSVWIDSAYNDETRKSEVINKYFLSQL